MLSRHNFDVPSSSQSLDSKLFLKALQTIHDTDVTSKSIIYSFCAPTINNNCCAELIKGVAGVELPLFSISHECQSITPWTNIKTLSYQNKIWQLTISSSNNATKPEMLKISLNVRSHTREIVHVYNIKPISCSMLSDHIDVEQSKTLSISWKDDHCGNNLRRNRKEGGHESLVPVVGAALVPISRAMVLEEVLMGYVWISCQ